MKNSHCSHCGTRFENTDWPRVCPNKPACGAQTWLNPDPVVVVLQPVIQRIDDLDRIGAIVGKRAIHPQKGQWSLISGFMNVGETAEDAARREFREETSLELVGEPRYCYSRFNDSGLLMLCFVVDTPMEYEEFIIRGQPCAENEALGVRWSGMEADLAFPLQSEFFDKWDAGEFRL